MSQTIDNMAMALRATMNLPEAVRPNNQALIPWDMLREDDKSYYRRIVWATIHAMLLDMEECNIYPNEDMHFEQDGLLMLYKAQASPSNANWVAHDEGRTAAEALVAAIDRARNLMERRR